MLTNNFRTLMSLILQFNSQGAVKGLLPVTNVNGNTYYAANQESSSFPGSTATDPTLTASNPGISFGTGSTAAAESDYQLEAPITSGLAFSLVKSCGLDASGYPYLQFEMMVLSTTDAAITISEIGYKQNLRCSDSQFGTSITARTCLLDRTVFANPVVIPPNDYRIIRYMLKTVIPASQ